MNRFFSSWTEKAFTPLPGSLGLVLRGSFLRNTVLRCTQSGWIPSWREVLHPYPRLRLRREQPLCSATLLRDRALEPGHVVLKVLMESTIFNDTSKLSGPLAGQAAVAK